MKFILLIVFFVVMKARPITVGYAFNPKKLRRSNSPHRFTTNDRMMPLFEKWSGGGLSDIVGNRYPCDDEKTGIKQIVFSPFFNNNRDDINFDVILHKLTEDIDNLSLESIEKLSKLKNYISQHPNTVVVDPIENVSAVVDRVKTTLRLDSLRRRLSTRCPFNVPTNLVLQNSDTLTPNEILSHMISVNLSFPLICKHVEACGTPRSHEMKIITNVNDLYLIDHPCLLQHFYDHSAVLYKVYVIGDEVMVFARKSLPSIGKYISLYSDGHSNASVRSLCFDSRKEYPCLADFVNLSCLTNASESVGSTADLGSSNSNDIIVLMHDKFQSAAMEISKEFGLSIFGFDVIVPESSESSEIYVVDINYFPSFKEVENFPEKLNKFLITRASQNFTS